MNITKNFNLWFTSDLHLNHSKIITKEYSNRPFKNIQEMNEVLIERWNNVVKKNHRIYVLGDFAFGNPEPFLKRLNGYKILIRGNHDKYNFKKAINIGFKEVYDLKDIKINNIRVTLCHYPMYSWNRSHRGAIQLYGHVHEKPIKFVPTRYHVGVDTNNFTPVCFDYVYEKIQEQIEFRNNIYL